MPWEDELRRLDEDREAFRDFDEARPLPSDRLSPRQRVDALLDAGTFLEIGARARGQGGTGDPPSADGAVPGDGIVAGFGTVAGRAIGAVAEDPLALARTDGEVGKNKVLRVLAHAYQGRLPVVYFADGPATPSAVNPPADGGLLGRYSDRAVVVPDLHLEARESPLLMVVFGRLRAESRLLAAAADLVIERRDAAAPARLANPDHELADVAVASDEEAVAVVLRFLTLVPASSGTALACSADSAALGPTRRLRDDVDPAALSVRELLAAVFDQHSTLAFDAAGDPALLAGLARIGGYPVAFAIGAEDVGGLGEARLRRLLRVARIASRFRLPIVFLQHGAAYGRDAVESPRAIERLAELVRVLHDADVPKLCVVSARGHVLGDFVLGGRELGTHYVAAWPQSRVGTLDLPAFTLDAASADGDDGPWAAAGLGLLDDVILPGETPARLAAMLRLLAPSRAIPPAHLDYQRRIPFR